MPEAAHKPAGEVDKPAAADNQEEAGRPEAVDRRVEEASGIQAAADKSVGVWQEEVDKPGEGAEIAVEEPLLLRLAYRMTRKSGHCPQDYGRNRCKNVEPFFTSLADFIQVQLLWHIRKADSMGFGRNVEINSF